MLERVKITPVEIPLKGLKRRALQRLSSPNGCNFEFLGGVKIEFPNGIKYHVWCFDPPGESYTWWELENVAQQVFDKVSRQKGLPAPEILSTGIEHKALLVIESVGTPKYEKFSTEGDDA